MLRRQHAPRICGAVPMTSGSPQPVSTEIAHVLCMDVVAYSLLPMDQQQAVIQELQHCVRETDEYRKSLKRRQLLRLPTGDGMALVFFGDPEAPVRCAVEISRALRAHPEVELRMGVHTGLVYRI